MHDLVIFKYYLVAKSCPTLFFVCVTPWTVDCQAPLSIGFPGKNTGVACYFLLQGIFPTQGLNPCLLHWQVDSLPLSHQGSPCPSLSYNMVPRPGAWTWSALGRKLESGAPCSRCCNMTAFSHDTPPCQALLCGSKAFLLSERSSAKQMKLSDAGLSGEPSLQRLTRKAKSPSSSPYSSTHLYKAHLIRGTSLTSLSAAIVKMLTWGTTLSI